jgi:hypothetical protein
MQIEINECTAWSCPHGLSRWSLGCDCTPGDHQWKAALRRAFDNLSNQLDEVYEEHVRQNLKIDPWPIRENYLRVRLGQLTESQLLREAKLNKLNAKEAEKLLTLLQAQFYRQRMYVSCTFFFEDLDRPEPRYGIANATRALMLVAQATGIDLCPAFRNDLEPAVASTGITGANILDEVLVWAEGDGKG